jgi:hypothetical protein
MQQDYPTVAFGRSGEMIRQRIENTLPLDQLHCHSAEAPSILSRIKPSGGRGQYQRSPPAREQTRSLQPALASWLVSLIALLSEYPSGSHEKGINLPWKKTVDLSGGFFTAVSHVAQAGRASAP